MIPNPTSFGRTWRTRLASRLALSFFFPALAVAILASGAALVQARNALRESAYERLRAATDVRAAQFDRWVDEQVNDLSFLSSLPSVHVGLRSFSSGRRDAASDTLAAVLHRAVMMQRDFTRVYMVSADGTHAVGSSDGGWLGALPASENLVRGDHAGQVVHNAYSSSADAPPTMTVTYPVRDERGNVRGTLVGDINLSRIHAVISERAGLGSSGEAYLVNRAHQLVSRGGDSGATRARAVHAPTIDAAVSGHSGSGIYRNYAGDEVIGVYRWLPEQEIALFAEMHADEALAPARRLAWVILLTGLLGAVALGVGVRYVARQIAGPVLAIADAAQKVAGGDLTTTAPVRTRDEIGRLAIAFNVMTARLRALYGGLESQVRATQDAARETEEGRRLLRAVIDNLPALVAVQDMQGRYLMVNESFSILDEAASDEQQLSHAREVLPATEEERVAAARDAMLARRRPEPVERTFVVNGEERVFLTSRFPLLDERGEAYALGAVATDITERKRLETQILHQQKIEAVGRLAGGVAHDINNLLTAVRCNAELLLDGMEPGDPDRQHLEEIDRSVRNGAALTRQLLTFSRAHVVRSSALDLNRILGGMASMLRRYVGAGIDMQFVLGEELWLVYADEGQMEQVLLNLLSNAHDSMPAGGTATVTTSNVVVGSGGLVVPNLAPGEYVRLSVSDTGTGIEADVLPLLFEPFFTTKEAGRGTGLGLSTAYAIVQQARGAITVDTKLGAGTTFSVLLPRHRDETVTAAPVPTPPSTPASMGEMLLVVDDEPSVRTSLRRMLARHGYRIVEAESGQDALEQFALHENEIALMLTDVFMPVMSGHQLAGEIRARAPGLPVIFMSGYTADEVERRGLMQETTRFLQKPFERKALVALVEELLAARGG